MAYKIGVVGAAGFAGIELVRIILQHPEFSLHVITSDSLAGEALSKVYPAFTGASQLVFQSLDKAPLAECDLVFLAVPHTAALKTAPSLHEQGVTVVDLSADFRLKDATVYESWYNTPHTAQDLLKETAFGLPEITGDELALAATLFANGKAPLVACAGCYPTATSLAAAPALATGLMDSKAPVIVDAISGVTGAGKKATERTHFCFANENLEAYSPGCHRHTPEIEQILDIEGRLLFTPHLAPLNRGLLSTVNIHFDESATLPTTEELVEVYRTFYKNSPFVHVLNAGTLPKTSSVAGTNCASIGLSIQKQTRMLIAVCAIDNLGKGASGQAVQCANIVCGLPQQTGLTSIALPV